MLKNYGKFLLSILTGVLISFFLNPIFAFNYHDYVPNPGYPFVASLSAGLAWQTPGKTQTLALTPAVTRTYTADSHTSFLATSNLFLGVQQQFSENLQSQLGLDLAVTGNSRVSGDIWEDATPAFNNFDYFYEINHRHIALKAKLLPNLRIPAFNWQLKPWVSATAGMGFNTAHSFMNTPSIFAAVASPNFSDHTTTSFTYALGLGAQYQLSKNWQMGLGYEFSDWGKSKLGSVPGVSNDQKPSLAKLYSHAILINLTFLA